MIQSIAFYLLMQKFMKIHELKLNFYEPMYISLLSIMNLINFLCMLYESDEICLMIFLKKERIIVKEYLTHEWWLKIFSCTYGFKW